MRDAPRDSAPSTPRRRFLRRTVGTVATGGLGATAGCLGNVRDDVLPPAAVTVEADATRQNSHSTAEFASYVERQREQYGDYGVWGTAGSEPDHGLSFIGAWTETLTLSESGDATTDPASPRAVVDAAAALYGATTQTDSGVRRYQLWLWAGGRLPGEQADGLLAATRTLRRVEVGAALAGDGAEIGPYSPASDYAEGPVTVSAATPGFGGLSTSFPLDTGTVRVAPERTGFDQNAYAVQWRGDTSSTQSVNGTCEASWADDSDPSFVFGVRLAADRNRL